MKKLLLILTVLSLLFVAIACNNDNTTSTTAPTNVSTSTTTTTPTTTQPIDSPTTHEHTAGEWVIVEEAQKTVDGYKTQSCTECGEELAREILYATGSEGLDYYQNYGQNTCYVKGVGTCTDTDIYIPAYIDGLKVTEVKSLYSSKTVTSVTIANGIQFIGKNAFSFCDNLHTIVLPDSIISIGDSAFYSCKSLATINIPESVTTIGDEAFYNCISLTEITIPKSVVKLGEGVFFKCKSITNLIVDDENPNYQSIDGNLYTKDGTVLIQYATAKTEKSFVIPETVTKIDKYAFYLSNLYNVTFPEGLKELGEAAFANSFNLRSINLPNGIDTIPEYAFAYCIGLESVTIPESVLYIESHAFYDCELLTSVVLPSKLTKISNHIFAGCYKLKTINIPESVTTIGESPFSSTLIYYVYIPASVTQIDASAFTGTVNVDTFEVAAENQHYQAINGNLYTKDGKTLIRYAAANTNTSFTIPNGVTHISKEAFYYAQSLTSVTIPASVTRIEERAFGYCYDITEFIFEGTKAEWENVKKMTDWDKSCGYLDYPLSGYEYTVKCTDGDIIVKK